MSTLTTRGLFRKAALTDPADAAVLAGQLGDDIDAKILLWAVGTTGGMPASSFDGRLYHDTTLDRLLYDQGTTWRKLLYQNAAGIYAADNIVDATGYRVSGTALAASSLSNGVTGSGAVVLAGTPTLTGVPLSTTPSVDDNTTKIATTAYVVGQAGSATPIIDGTGTVGTSLRYARQDHIHPTDTTRAPLASPTLTGVPAAPTAAPGTNTTQIATTAFVTANGTHVEKGKAVSVAGSGTSITFASAFGSLPTVICGIMIGDPAANAGGGEPPNYVSYSDIATVSTTGFTLYHSQGGTRTVPWHAI